MVDQKLLQDDLAKKLGIAPRTVRSRIAARENAALVSRSVAALMVAQEAGLVLKRYASGVEIEELRRAVSGSSPHASVHGVATSAQPLPRTSARAARAVSPRRPRGKTVFVVHGRNDALRKAMFRFLRSVGLNPMEWSAALRTVGTGTPTILEVVEHMANRASGVVVLVTPDDVAHLKPELASSHDPEWEVQPTGQARPNVLFEAGIAVALFPKNTVFVQVGAVRPFTDIAGVHLMRLNDSPESRNEFVQKLQAANIVADTSGSLWYSEGKFEQETYE